MSEKRSFRGLKGVALLLLGLFNGLVQIAIFTFRVLNETILKNELTSFLYTTQHSEEGATTV